MSKGRMKVVNGKRHTGKLPMKLQVFAEDPKPQDQQPAPQAQPQAQQQAQAQPQQAPQQMQAAQQPVQQPQAPQAPQAPANLQMPQAPMQQQGPDVMSVLNSLSQSVQGLQSAVNQPAQPTAEDIQAANERLIEEFNSNPQAVLDRIQQTAVEKANKTAMQKMEEIVKPMQQQMQNVQWTNATRKFINGNPQSRAYIQTMNSIMENNPQMREMAKTNPDAALNQAYQMAVGQKFMGQGGNVVDNIVADETMRSQILSNPEIQQQVIAQYVASLNNGTQVPPLMGNGNQQVIAPTPVNQPKNIKDAKAAALARAQAYDQNSLT